MSFLDSLKQDALAVLHATANALHAQLANTLSQAGHPVSEADHVDTLVQTAQQSATGAAGAPVASTQAPNYADHALATFNQSMTAALIQFAQQHLPAKFQGVASDAVQTVSDVLDDGKVTAGEAASAVANVGAAVAAAVVPGAAPIAGAAAAIVNAVASGSTSVKDAGAAVAATALQAGESIAEAAADKALPGAGAIVGAAVEALEATFAKSSTADTTPAANTSGV